jgi:hypothetical protein
MIDSQNEKDKKIAKLQPFIDPIVKRALKKHREYMEISNELGEFEVSKTEMDCLVRYFELLLGRKDQPDLCLGMKIVVTDKESVCV